MTYWRQDRQSKVSIVSFGLNAIRFTLDRNRPFHGERRHFDYAIFTQCIVVHSRYINVYSQGTRSVNKWKKTLSWSVYTIFESLKKIFGYYFEY